MRTILALALPLVSGCSLIFDADDRVGTPVDAGRDARTVDAPMIDAGPPADAPADAPSTADAGPIDAGPPCDLRAPWYTGAPDARVLCTTGPMIGPLSTPMTGMYSSWLSVAVAPRDGILGPVVMMGLVGNTTGSSSRAMLGSATIGAVPAAPFQFESGPVSVLDDVGSFDLRVQGDCSVGWVAQGRAVAGESGIHLGRAEACTSVGLVTQLAPMLGPTSTSQPIAAVSRSGGSSLAFWTELPGPRVVMGSNNDASLTSLTTGVAATYNRVLGTIEPRALVDATATGVIWLRPEAGGMSTIPIGTNRGDLGFATLDAEDDLDVVAFFSDTDDVLELRALGESESCPAPVLEDVTFSSIRPSPMDVASMPGGGIVLARAVAGDLEVRFFDRRLVPVAIEATPTLIIPSGSTRVDGVSVDAVQPSPPSGEVIVVVGFVELTSSSMARYGYVAIPIPGC